MKSNRRHELLQLLTENQRMEVAVLSEKLGVSQVTIRKDLDELEHQGIVVREHGFATLRSTDNINGRIAYHYEEKLLIAKRAAELVRDGETIMIESGSCCALLAATLAECKRDLTIITNSAFIADYVKDCDNVQVVLLGGIYQRDAQVMVGPMVRQCAENFFVDRFFIGVDGYSVRTGFTNQNQLRAQAVRDMAHQAEQVFVLTESEKFSHRGVVPMNLKGLKCTVLTDRRISAECREMLEHQSIEVITV